MSSHLPHLAGLPDAMPTLHTPGFRKTQHIVDSAVRHGEIAAITGDAGLGKTFAVTHAVTTTDLPHVWVQIGPAPRPKEVCARVLKHLTGAWQPGTLYELTDDIVAELTEDPHIVIIDEAQNLDKAGLDQIRLLHDLSANGFPLVLVGGASCARTLQSDPQLADRVGGWSEFGPLPRKALFDLLPTYHSIFEHTDPLVLADLNDKYAHGVLRRWARILKLGLEFAPRTDTPHLLNTKAASAILSVVNARTRP